MKKLFSAILALAACCATSSAADVTESFDGLATGTEFEMTSAQGGTATVAENPIGEGKILDVTNSNYDAVPQISFKLPEGKTLGDCTAVSFSLYIPSSNSDGTANYKQKHIYLNGILKYKDTDEQGNDVYPKLGEKDTWISITVSTAALQLTEEEKSLTSFTLGVGLNDNRLHYYLDNVSLKYPYNTTPPVLPAQGAYYTGEYRNLFLEAGYTQEQIDQRLDDLWHTYFEGDEDNERLYYEVGDDMAYILDANNNDVRTEGMSYGMMICVQMDRQDEFNRIWKWAKTYMQFKPGDEREGYFSWQLPTDASSLANTPASDGEEYFIMALMFASNRWGNGEGIYDYEAEADYIIKNCFNKPMTEVSPYSSFTNLFNMDEKQITFVPYASSAKFTDPSYHLPAFYELWAMWAKEHNQDFKDFAAKSREMFPKFAHAETGLMPDYAEYDGSPHTGDGDHSGFLYDAWRCIMNMAVDFSWFQPEDVDYTALVNRQHNFLATVNGGVPNYYSVYTLDGQQKNGNTDHSPGLVACNATGTLASNQMVAWEFIDDFMATAIPTGRYRYYDGLLYFLNFLHASGNFRIWKPQSGTGITDVPATPGIHIDGGMIHLGGNTGGRYRIVNLGSGTVIMSGTAQHDTIDIAALPHGIYAISVDGKTLKFIK